MMKMTGGQALAQQLAREGVTDVFGVPGLQLDWALDGLRQVQNRIRFTVTRHEQAASYMADGYARTTDRLGVCMVVPGPGLLNAMSGLATAYACSSPVLCISGNIHSGGIGKGRGLLHEINNQSGVLAVVTKWQGTASSPREIPAVVREAAKQMRSGRPRPAGIEIAHDVLAASDEVELIDPPADEDGRLVPQPREIDEAVAALAAARLPVIYAGGGAVDLTRYRCRPRPAGRGFPAAAGGAGGDLWTGSPVARCCEPRPGGEPPTNVGVGPSRAGQRPRGGPMLRPMPDRIKRGREPDDDAQLHEPTQHA
jgi:acetolactate synthase-1/2/3 large subunit